MSLAKPLPALRQDLRDLLVEDLPTALRALDELLPDGSDKKAPVTALRSAFNQLNRERGLGVIDHAAYALRLAQLSANFLSLLDTLTEADFEPPAAPVKSGPPEPKRGSVLYKIPRQMPLRKASLCTVRVAVDEEAIFDDLVLDDGVRLRKRVEVSDMMTAELLDIEGNVFQVAAFNDVRQRVRDTGYTQWLFRVTPLVEGEHQLMVKVSLMEFDPNTHEYVPRNVSILETVTIVTEVPAPSDSDDTPLRATGHQFALGPTEQEANGKEQAAEMPPPSPKATTSKSAGPLQTSNSRTSTRRSRSEGGSNSRPLRAMALFLAFVMLGSTATFAFTPQDTRAWLWTRYVQDSEAAYTEFIDKHPQSKYVEEAANRRMLLSPTVSNLRAAENLVCDEQRRAAVLAKLNEVEISELQTLRANPSSENLQRFLQDFPHSERLGQAIEAVAANPELRAAAEARAYEALQQQPTARNIDLFRTVFPNSQRKEELQRLAQSAGATPSRPGTDPAEERDWAAATAANTLEAYAAFVNKYRNSAHRPEVRQRVLALRPNMTPEEQAWVDADLNGTPEGYIYFVQKYPRSARNAAARERIKTFSLSVKERKRLETEVAERLRNEQAAEAESQRQQDAARQQEAQRRSEEAAQQQREKPKSEAVSPPIGGGAGGGVGRKSSLTMIPVSGGTFLMGSPKSEEGRNDDECQHSVTVKTFSIGKYEVTQADWREVMGKDPVELYNKGCDDCPVEKVSWDDVQDFLKKLNAQTGKKYRLPTEAEWEYAARGGAKSEGYTYAGSNTVGEVAWYDDNFQRGNTSFGSKKSTRPVGTKKANELGLYDMSGSVYEWCRDKYGPYPGCTGTEGSHRMLRGGSWYFTAPDCRVANRTYSGPMDRRYYIGFRLASSPQ